VPPDVVPPDVVPPEVVPPDVVPPDVVPDDPDEPDGQLPLDVVDVHAFSAWSSVYGYLSSLEDVHLHRPVTQTYAFDDVLWLEHELLPDDELVPPPPLSEELHPVTEASARNVNETRRNERADMAQSPDDEGVGAENPWFAAKTWSSRPCRKKSLAIFFCDRAAGRTSWRRTPYNEAFP
jgi:hypothetical protein